MVDNGHDIRLLQPGNGLGGLVVIHQDHPLAAGAEQVTLPLVPFPGFARNEQQWKGDLSYLIYREVPWDVALTFVPCDQWDGWDDLEER